MFSLDALFCDVDDFCNDFEPQRKARLLKGGGIKRVRAKSLCLSEIMTILIAFHQNHYRTFGSRFKSGNPPNVLPRNFKRFYFDCEKQHWHSAFPGLPSYRRFVEWKHSTLIPLRVYLKRCFGNPTGVGFVDATSLKVYHNRRIKRHKVFDGLAVRGKTSVDWFSDFKLHLVVNEVGQLLNGLEGAFEQKGAVIEKISSESLI